MGLRVGSPVEAWLLKVVEVRWELCRVELRAIEDDWKRVP